MDIFKLKREFLEYCELYRGQSALTISNYDRYLSKFLEWLKVQKLETQEAENIGNSLQEISASDIDQESVRQYRLYINRLQDKKGRELKATTQNYHMIALRAFLRYLSFRGISSLSPEKINIAKTGDREITFLTADELEKMLNAPQTINNQTAVRDRALLETLFSTGMRVSEVSNLNIEDINFQTGEIAVLGKGKKIRVVFLSNSALEWINKYLLERGESDGECDSPLFLSNKQSRLSVRTIERIVSKHASISGLSKKISPHTFRHSFATDLLTAGADVRSVQSLLGHSSITTTQIYTHITDNHLKEVHQAFHGKTIGHSERSEEPHEDHCPWCDNG